MKESRLKLDIKKTFFTMTGVRHWHILPREVTAPYMEVFKAGWMGL